MDKFKKVYLKIITQSTDLYDKNLFNLVHSYFGQYDDNYVSNRKKFMDIIKKKYHLGRFDSYQIYYYLPEIVLEQYSDKLTEEEKKELKNYIASRQVDIQTLKQKDKEHGSNVPNELHWFFTDLGLDYFTKPDDYWDY